MSSFAIIEASPQPANPIWIGTSAEAKRGECLDLAQLITEVSSDSQRELAASALRDCKELSKDTENSRKLVKRPVLDLEEKIDTIAKEFIKPVAAEVTRLERLIGDYEHKLRKEREAKERAQREEAARLEQERIKAEQDARKATTIEQETEARERAIDIQQERQQVLAAVVAPAQPTSVKSKEDWDFTVVDPAEVFKARPDLCEIIVKRRETKAAITLGMRQCPGLLITETTKIKV